MANSGQTIGLLAILGGGGYLAYEYFQYSSAINAIASTNVSLVPQIQAALPFLTYISMNWGAPAQSQEQQQVYQAMQAYLGGTLTAASAPQTPGTTSTTQPTSVSTVPSTTPTPGSNASTAPATTPPPAPPAPAPQSTVPIQNQKPGLAVLMQQKLNTAQANPDQWNWAYSQIMGQDVDTQNGFNFANTYGTQFRTTGATMSANQFLNMASNATPGGLGAIAQFAGPSINTQGNLMYQQHHPFPYVATYSLGRTGLGAPTEATGMEKTLFTNRRLRSSLIR